MGSKAYSPFSCSYNRNEHLKKRRSVHNENTCMLNTITISSWHEDQQCLHFVAMNVFKLWLKWWLNANICNVNTIQPKFFNCSRWIVNSVFTEYCASKINLYSMPFQWVRHSIFYSIKILTFILMNWTKISWKPKTTVSLNRNKHLISRPLLFKCWKYELNIVFLIFLSLFLMLASSI